MLTQKSLLDCGAMSRKTALKRIEDLRELLSTLVEKIRPDPKHVRYVIEQIAECRAIVGPPVFIAREYDNARKPRNAQPPLEGGHFVAHEGKRQ